ncbi:MAG: hypothetical protein NZ551_03780 [Microscillaceae bacterium]|nr:hypothetical protein [Microscillaceae bacterium]MDW8460309.1 hypothetical protein [Cytophagales bacterium]
MKLKLAPLKYAFLSFLLAYFAPFQVTTAQNSWQVYEFNPGGFRMMFPTQPTVSFLDDNALQARAISNATVYRAVTIWNRSYNMSIANDLLKESESLLKPETDKVESNQNFTFLSFPSKEIRFRTDRGSAVIFRTIITPNQLFQFYIIRNQQYASESEVNQFFGSFQLVK